VIDNTAIGSVSHVYATAGQYTASLVVSGAGGVSTPHTAIIDVRPSDSNE